MSDILAAQRKRVAEAPPSGNGEAAGAAPAAEEADLPVVDRIVLYIDDLDRCPPRRVVEVLEAVHLILALPLFVVVVAVDPRWLLQSLRLHYAELLSEVRADARERLAAARAASRNGPADAPAAPGAGPDGVDTAEIWESTPLHYLEKIFQIPFALRPVSEAGVASLVSELLPIETTAVTSATSAPTDDTEAPEQAAVSTGEAAPELGAPAEVSGAVRPTIRPSLSPRSLALTGDERDFAARAAGVLDTPRAVKKFTNLYRLVRAGLDADSGELDAFLDAEGERHPGVPDGPDPAGRHHRLPGRGVRVPSEPRRPSPRTDSRRPELARARREPEREGRRLGAAGRLSHGDDGDRQQRDGLDQGAVPALGSRGVPLLLHDGPGDLRPVPRGREPHAGAARCRSSSMNGAFASV